MRKLQDLTPVVIRALNKRTIDIVTKAFDKLFPGEEFRKEDMGIEYEKVDNWSMPIYTVRYKGRILCRRFSIDMFGLKYEYESPIFEE